MTVGGREGLQVLEKQFCNCLRFSSVSRALLDALARYKEIYNEKNKAADQTL
jgi:hypothetical protein